MKNIFLSGRRFLKNKRFFLNKDAEKIEEEFEKFVSMKVRYYNSEMNG